MTCGKQNPTFRVPEICREEEERLLAVWKLLKELERSEYPAIRAGCGRAGNEVWQVIFELGLRVEGEETLS